jgi:hypothetical protein
MRYRQDCVVNGKFERLSKIVPTPPRYTPDTALSYGIVPDWLVKLGGSGLIETNVLHFWCRSPCLSLNRRKCVWLDLPRYGSCMGKYAPWRGSESLGLKNWIINVFVFFTERLLVQNINQPPPLCIYFVYSSSKIFGSSQLCVLPHARSSIPSLLVSLLSIRSTPSL